MQSWHIEAWVLHGLLLLLKCHLTDVTNADCWSSCMVLLSPASATLFVALCQLLSCLLCLLTFLVVGSGE